MCRNQAAALGEGQGALRIQNGARQGPNTAPARTHSKHPKPAAGSPPEPNRVQLGRTKAPESLSMCRNQSASSGEGEGAVRGQHGPRKGPNTAPARTHSTHPKPAVESPPEPNRARTRPNKSPESPSMCRNQSADLGEGQGAVGGQHGPQQGPNTAPARTQKPKPLRRKLRWA